VPPDPDGFIYAKGPERARTVKGRPSAGLWRTETVKTKRRIKMKDNYENLRKDICEAFDSYENGMIRFAGLIIAIDACTNKASNVALEIINNKIAELNEELKQYDKKG
jgi:hypothetical protein